MNLETSRILVTGGAGFIGSALVWGLNRRGCESIVIADRLGGSDKWRNLPPLRFEDYIEADDLLPALESGALGSFDLVLHLGACSSTTETDATYLIHNNFEFTKQIAILAVRDGARFVYASSAATYGLGDQGMNDADDSVVALSELRPLNMYGYSKHMFDLWAARQGILRSITGLKYFNIYGPNEAHKASMRSVVAKAFPQVRDEGRIQLFRSHHPDFAHGEQQRDFLYIKDAVAMTLHLAERSDAVGIFNIGSGETSTWLDLAHALFAAAGIEGQVEFIDMPESLRAKYQYYTRADIARLRKAGFVDSITPLREGIVDYVRNYLIPDTRLGDETR